jgi:hypothetical protein
VLALQGGARGLGLLAGAQAVDHQVGTGHAQRLGDAQADAAVAPVMRATWPANSRRRRVALAAAVAQEVAAALGVMAGSLLNR